MTKVAVLRASEKGLHLQKRRWNLITTSTMCCEYHLKCHEPAWHFSWPE